MCAIKLRRSLLLLLLVNYRDGLDAPAAPGAGPAGSVEQVAADLPLQAGSHLAPLTAPHDSRWGSEGKEGRRGKLDSQRETSNCQPFSLLTRHKKRFFVC